MVNIAIVEPNQSYRDDIYRILKLMGHSELQIIDTFKNFELYLQAGKDRYYQIVILSGAMVGFDYLHSTKRVWDCDSNILFILLSTSKRHAYDVYGLNIYRHILYESIEMELAICIADMLLMFHKIDKSRIFVKTQRKYLSIQQSDIICIKYENRRPVIYTCRGKRPLVGMSLKKLYTLLPSTQFVQVNSGTLVNLDYFMAIDDSLITLRMHPEEIVVSRSRLKRLVLNLRSYYERNYLEKTGRDDSSCVL